MVQQFIVLIHVLAQSHSCVLSSTIWWPTKSLYIRTSLWLDTLCHTFTVILILEAGGLSAICRLTARDASAHDTAEGRKWNSGAEAIKTSLPWQMSRSSHQPRRLLLLLQRFLLLSLSTPRAGHSEAVDMVYCSVQGGNGNFFFSCLCHTTIAPRGSACGERLDGWPRRINSPGMGTIMHKVVSADNWQRTVWQILECIRATENKWTPSHFVVPA